MRLSASSFLSAALAVGAVSTVSAVSAAETVGVDKRAAPSESCLADLFQGPGLELALSDSGPTHGLRDPERRHNRWWQRQT